MGIAHHGASTKGVARPMNPMANSLRSRAIIGSGSPLKRFIPVASSPRMLEESFALSRCYLSVGLAN